MKTAKYKRIIGLFCTAAILIPVLSACVFASSGVVCIGSGQAKPTGKDPDHTEELVTWAVHQSDGGIWTGLQSNRRQIKKSGCNMINVCCIPIFLLFLLSIANYIIW